MEIRKILLKEHSKANTLKVVEYVGVSKKRFNELVNIYLEGPYRVTQRAAWPLSYCVERHPALIYPHLKRILTVLGKHDIPVAVKRNTLRLLQFIEVPEKYCTQVIDLCFDFLLSKKEPVAVKVFAMTVLSRVIKNEEDLKKELRIIIEDQLPYASAGYRARARTVLKDIK